MGEIFVYTIAIGLAMLGSFALGMYVTTQISDWIKKNIKKQCL